MPLGNEKKSSFPFAFHSFIRNFVAENDFKEQNHLLCMSGGGIAVATQGVCQCERA
jgi:hypothetical protein